MIKIEVHCSMFKKWFELYPVWPTKIGQNNKHHVTSTFAIADCIKFLVISGNFGASLVCVQVTLNTIDIGKTLQQQT